MCGSRNERPGRSPGLASYKPMDGWRSWQRKDTRWVEPELQKLEAVVVVIPEVVLEAGVEEGDRCRGARGQRLIRGAERNKEQARGDVLELRVLGPHEMECRGERAKDLRGGRAHAGGGIDHGHVHGGAGRHVGGALRLAEGRGKTVQLGGTSGRSWKSAPFLSVGFRLSAWKVSVGGEG